MFIIVLQKSGLEKVYSQVFETETEALRKLNDFRPDYTGYVASLTRTADQFGHGVPNI